MTRTLKIPAVTALYAENPGTDLYKDQCYILQTENNAAKMRQVVKQVAVFAKRLVEGDLLEMVRRKDIMDQVRKLKSTIQFRHQRER